MPRIGLISLYVSHAPVYNERATCVQQTQAFWTIHPVLGRRLTARRLHILAPNIAPNTDGFDPDSIQDVSFTDSYVSNGDDAIAIKAGWDCAGYASKEAAPCDNIYIRNITQNRGGGRLVARYVRAIHPLRFLPTQRYLWEHESSSRMRTFAPHFVLTRLLYVLIIIIIRFFWSKRL